MRDATDGIVERLTARGAGRGDRTLEAPLAELVAPCDGLVAPISQSSTTQPE